MISSSDILHGKVLIVDDLEVNIILLERMLRGAIDIKGKGEMHTWFLDSRNR